MHVFTDVGSRCVSAGSAAAWIGSEIRADTGWKCQFFWSSLLCHCSRLNMSSSSSISNHSSQVSWWGWQKKNNQKTTNYPATAIETNRWWEKWSVCDAVSDRWQMHCSIKRDYCFAGLLEKGSALQLLWQLRCNLGINVIVCWRGWHFKTRAGRRLRPWRTKSCVKAVNGMNQTSRQHSLS